MLERFTVAAREVVVRAGSEARRRQDRHVGTEHLLIAVSASAEVESMLDGGDGRLGRALEEVEAEALDSVGVDIGRLVVEPEYPTSGRRGEFMGFTGAAKDVLKLSLREARGLGDDRIAPEHLLLALTTLPADDLASRLLDRSGIDPAAVRSRILDARRDSA